MKFQLKKVLCMGVAVGNVGMTPDELRRAAEAVFNLVQMQAWWVVKHTFHSRQLGRFGLVL